MIYFFKQKTAYEMRISDWSSDVCASDLLTGAGFAQPPSNADVPTAAASPACPESRPIRPPLFPVQMVREKRGGSVVLDLEVDACGRVIDASLRKRSRREFNEAAIASVM